MLMCYKGMGFLILTVGVW